MSLGFDNVDPNHTGPHYRYDAVANEPQSTDSQETIVQNPRPQPDIRARQPYLPPPSQMNPVPLAPSPPEAPTYHSYPSEEEVYGPERYGGGHNPDFPEYAASTPRPPSSVAYNPLPFATGGMQTDALVQRDFKDELARAAGTVTPGVSDLPNIRYAIEALTRQQTEEPRPVYGNGGAYDGNDEQPLRWTQIIPQFSVEVSRSPPKQPESPVAIRRGDESASYQPPIDRRGYEPISYQPPVTVHHEDEPTPSQFPIGHRGYERVPNGWKTPRSVPYSIPASVPVSPSVDRQAPVTEQRPAKHPYQARTDEIVENLNRNKALVEKGFPAPANHSPPRTVDVWRAQPDSFTQQDLEAVGYKLPPPPPLTHKPLILRPLSLLLLAAACTLAIAALIFSAIYSVGRDGFTAYGGSIYGGQYFLFRVLPQLIGAAILIYAQCVIAAVFRVFPLSAMASEDRRERRNAVLLPLYQRSFLWPQLFGPWHVWVPTLVVWLTNFTIPLLSSLYTVVFVNDVWIWSTVQGVAWTLVALYISLLASAVILFVYWRHRRTGMVKTWEIRSIADIVFLMSQSNSAPRYRRLETAATRAEMEKALDGTAERLGYWTTPEAPENSVFWSFGVPTMEDGLGREKWDQTNNWAAARRDGSHSHSHPVMMTASSDVEDQKEPWAVRDRYLPWCFRDSPIVFFVVAGTALLVALVVVSFLPATDLRKGFLPRLSAAPLSGAFSPADFLYSFLPSLIGLLLFLGFQSLEVTLRVLTPWGELAREEGSRAETSLLLDYAACLPWQSTYRAARLGHWRVAFVTFLAPLFVLLPVLGGGLFMALTPPDRVVRMFPNVPIFGVLLALLFLYLAALALLVPNRKQFRLPHAVTCLAEIMSFCCSEQLRTDEAFGPTRRGWRRDLEDALDCGRDRNLQSRWTFGAGRNDEERMGIKRHSKFTVNPTKQRHYDRYVRSKPISAPLPSGNGPLA